jgi:hypothetical protein
MQAIKLGKTLPYLALLAPLTLGACSKFEIENAPPVAVAQVLVNGTAANIEEPIPFMGAPLAITLDGNASTDEDGRVASYRWLQTDVSNIERYAGNGLVDAGTLPPFAGDPPAGPAPSVSLGEGTYQYSLWVTDDEGAVSEPATVEFTIKTPTNYMPDAMCKMNYMSAIAECVDCVCTPTAMMGCLDNYNACYLNTDAMFVTLCTAIVNCAREKGCTGMACNAADKCMAEITAGATYMGAMACTGPAATDPCSAARELGACTSMGTCMAACTN